jgi:hypothetical protein
MDKEHGLAAGTYSSYMQYGYLCRNGHAAWNNVEKHHGHAVFHFKDIEHRHAAQTLGIDIKHLHVVWICSMEKQH